MISFLYDAYGYYPQQFSNNEFEIANWCFKLIETDFSDSELLEYDGYLEVIRDKFNGKGAFIIKTREGKIASFHDNKKYVLISVKLCDMSITDLNKMHCLMTEDDKIIDLSSILKVWQERVEFIEFKGITSLDVTNVYYKKNLEIALYGLGVAQNAIQYLSDIISDYGSELGNLSVCHKRLKNFNSFDFFDPFNMIVDHPVRDLSDLYKNDGLSFVQLINILNYYSIDSKVASVLLARILYPSNIFDYIENYIGQQENIVKFNYNIEKEIEKCKKIYLYLKKRYNTRPILWLDD